MQWFKTWQSAYDAGDSDTLQTVASLATKAFDQLERRKRFPVSVLRQWVLIPGQWRSLLKSWRVIKQKPTPISSDPVKLQTIANHERPIPLNFFSKQYTRQQTLGINQAAKALQCTPTQFMLTALFQTLNRWKQQNRSEASGKKDPIIRILVPMNERTSTQPIDQACNYCTILVLERTTSEIANRQQLLRSLVKEFKLIRRWRLSLNFWRVISVARRLPGGLAAQIDRFQPTATALLTNIGNVKRHFDELRPIPNIDRVAVIPTLHQEMPIGLALTLSDGKLETTLHFNHALLTQSDAESLFQMLTDHLESILPTG